MPREWVFDTPQTTHFTEARQAFLRRLLPGLREGLALRTALDAGCGVGHFSELLREMGFRVVAFDVRPENVEEAQRRFPAIEFRVADAEDSGVQRVGTFDVVLCFGLLYHLENPFRAVRNLHAMTGKLLLIESVCIPDPRPLVMLLEEPTTEDQSVQRIAFYPTESCVVKMCYRAGFPFVYRAGVFPVHDEFRPRLLRKRARMMLAASKVRVDCELLEPVLEPANDRDPWATAWTLVPRGWQFLRKPWSEKLSTLRRYAGRWGDGARR
jgi:SAM-dependent methyltransferase